MKPRSLLLAVLFSALAAPLAIFAADTNVKADKPAHVSMGEKVQLTDYLVPGKTTVFDFTSEFCPPCRAIAPRLAKLHGARDDIAVVSVDINRPGVKGIDWKSPVAQEFQLHSIPHFKVYGPDGKLLAQGDNARAMVEAWVK